jgi:hypothetical protein
MSGIIKWSVLVVLTLAMLLSRWQVRGSDADFEIIEDEEEDELVDDQVGKG